MDCSHAPTVQQHPACICTNHVCCDVGPSQPQWLLRYCAQQDKRIVHSPTASQGSVSSTSPTGTAPGLTARLGLHVVASRQRGTQVLSVSLLQGQGANLFLTTIHVCSCTCQQLKVKHMHMRCHVQQDVMLACNCSRTIQNASYRCDGRFCVSGLPMHIAGRACRLV
jgi:hypothetical protein